MRAAELTVGLRNYATSAPADWRHLLAQARAADAAGVDRIFVSDHLVFGDDLGDYGRPERGGRAGGKQPTGPDGDWLEPLTVLAAMAAVTTNVRLATNVLVAPLRPAVLLAKTAATVDVLSHGRLELGVGIGWQEAEYRALGLDFTRRGRLLDELLAACRELWTAREAHFTGESIAFTGVHMMPKPTRPGGVPIWIGGGALRAVARRLAAHGDGWIPWGATPGTFLDIVERMRPLVADAGGDLDRLRIAYSLTPAFTAAGAIDHAAMFAAVPSLLGRGVTDFRTLLRVSTDFHAALDMLAELAERFAGAVGRPPGTTLANRPNG